MIVEKRFAVLIDADNVSSKYVKYILDEISKYGVITYKRIYGDWTKHENASWKEILLENSILPIQQYEYTTGKNATDCAMIIDAMDILYSNKVEGFCLVSSDSDFTRLAARLRESGMMVVGMGEKKTPEAFRASCERFTYLDVLAEDEEQDIDGHINEFATKMDLQVIENAMIKIIMENEDDGKETGIGELGSRLIKMYPDFDVRNYGYTKLSKLLDSIPSLILETNGKTITVHVKETDIGSASIEKEILKLIKETGTKGMNMGELNQKLRLKYPDFVVRNYGYTKFSKFIKDLPDIIVKEDGRAQIQKIAKKK